MSRIASETATTGSGAVIELPQAIDTHSAIQKQRRPYGFQPGVSGNPGGRSKKVSQVNPLQSFTAKPLEKKVDDLKERAARIAYHTSDDILEQIQRAGKKDTVGLQRQMMVFGVAFDKVAANIEPEGFKVSVPADAFKHFSSIVIALKSNTAPPWGSVDNVQTIELPATHSHDAAKSLESKAISDSESVQE